MSAQRERSGEDGARAARPSLGALLVLAFAIQIATGTLLLVHFAADAERAFESVRTIAREVPWGWLVRGVHVQAANLMVIALLLHLLSTALRGAYKPPRRAHWISGCALLLLTFGASLTGYILPWSQLSYWATTVVTASIAYVPLVGEDLLALVRGSERVGPATFRRAFAAHVTLIPLLMLAGLALHAALVRRTGLAPPLRRGAGGEEPCGPALDRGWLRGQAPFAVGFLLLLFALVFFAPNLFLPAESFEPADPLETPPNAKPEWYFLWQYALPRLVPERVSLLLQALALGTLFALPFLDRGPERHPRDRPLVIAALLGAVLVWVALSLFGYLV